MQVKENEDLVSIVVPVYNCEKFIDYTIKTVLNQTYQNWELLLVDDCSTDNSISIINGYVAEDNRIKLIKLEKNSGAAVARNEGMKNAKGKYIAFLDSDDLWNENKLEKQINFMKKNKYVFTYTGYEFADEEGNKLDKIVKVPEQLTYKQALKNTTIFTSTVMFDLNKLTKEAIYMPDVKSEDTATWWKVLKKIEYAYGINNIVVLYRRSANTLSSNKIKAIRRIWNLYRNVEHLRITSSCYNFCFYMLNAVQRRL